MSRQSLKTEEKTEALESLHESLKPGDTVYTILRRVSRSGMSRSISLLVSTEDGPYEITHLAVRAGLGTFDRDNDGVKVVGCGMDMGFHLVYHLSYTMFPDGFACIGQGCPANDHNNDYLAPNRNRALDYSPGRHHQDGGYALQHRWL
mgnify:CR=1 FL=1